MVVRDVEGKKPYTGGKAIEITEDKVINLRLREENNLIIRDEGDNEIYVDLQLPDELSPLDAFPVGITTGRVIVDNGWDAAGTIVCFKTTSGDNIKLLYNDDGKLYIDNGTGTFKQIYLKGEVDALLLELRQYVDSQLLLKQDKLTAGNNIEIDANNVISAVLPPMSRFLSLWNCATGQPISFPATTPFEYVTGDHYLVDNVSSTNYRPDGIEYDGIASSTVETEEVNVGDTYIYDGTNWLLQHNVIPASAFSNLKSFGTFPGSGVSDLQDLYEWLAAGNYAEVTYDNMIWIFGPTNITTGTVESYYLDETPIDDSETGRITEKRSHLEFAVSDGNVTGSYGSLSAATGQVRGVRVNSVPPTVSSVSHSFWYDTSTHKLKAWNGTSWDIVGDDSAALALKQDKLTAGNNITIGDVCTTESDMKGPAPSGFHIPLQTEWVNLSGVLTTTFSLANNGVTLGTYLKMPMAGMRGYQYNTNVGSVGTAGRYWFSNPYGNASNTNSGNLMFSASSSDARNPGFRASGYSVRCLKNTPVVPDSSWTTLYDGSAIATDAGIFWNATEGLISISGDGTTWYTIMDKNLGATSVYNYGDTESDANCGYFYQWGNNYGFPHSGSVTASRTQIDSTGYGPGNYYSSSTYIGYNGGQGSDNWSSVNNRNLWGGDTQSTRQDCKLTISSTGGANYTAGSGIDITSDVISVDNTIAKAADAGNVRRFENTTASLQAMYDWLYNSTNRYGIVRYNSLQDFIFGPTTTTNDRVYSADGYKTIGYGWSGDRLLEDRYNVYYQVNSGIVSGTLGYVSSGAVIGSAVAFKSDVLTKTNTSSYTPSSDSNPATKLYADENHDYLVAGEGIEIDSEDVSRMKGPCDAGRHIPTSWEFIDIWDVLLSLGLSTQSGPTLSELETYYHMPAPGYINYYDGSYQAPQSSGLQAIYWASGPGGTHRASTYEIINNVISQENQVYRAQGGSIRPFKDIAVVPDNTWTTIYDGSAIATNAGIFMKNGMISLSKNGSTWYTIADKNLGATTVFNTGDTISEANSGKFYQWGNNRGFSRSGYGTTTTLVNTTGYGPNKPYKSYYNNFITVTSSPYDWSTVDNKNLWGYLSKTIKNTITGDVKVFHLSGTNSVTAISECQEIMDYVLTNKCAIIRYASTLIMYRYSWKVNDYYYFTAIRGNGSVSSGDWLNMECIRIYAPGGVVTASPVKLSNTISVSSSAPSSGTSNNTITLVI